MKTADVGAFEWHDVVDVVRYAGRLGSLPGAVIDDVHGVEVGERRDSFLMNPPADADLDRSFRQMNAVPCLKCGDGHVGVPTHLEAIEIDALRASALSGIRTCTRER
mgnify:CR=1 FL=1